MAKRLLQRCPTCRGAVWVICPSCHGNGATGLTTPPPPPEPSEDEIREARRVMRLEA